MKIMNLWVDEDDLAAIDELVRLGRFQDRSKFVRYAIKKVLLLLGEQESNEKLERAPTNV